MLATNALIMVSEMGRPTILLTLTCNIHWTQIEDQLLEGKTDYGKFQPVNYTYVYWTIQICVRPSRRCLLRFQSPIRCNNLCQEEYFGPHKVGYEIRLIEYQR